MLQFASRLCLLGGLGLLIAAGVWLAIYGNPKPPEEALVLETAEQDLGTLAVGTHTIEFTIHNRADKPYPIVGAKTA